MPRSSGKSPAALQHLPVACRWPKPQPRASCLSRPGTGPLGCHSPYMLGTFPLRGPGVTPACRSGLPNTCSPDLPRSPRGAAEALPASRGFSDKHLTSSLPARLGESWGWRASAKATTETRGAAHRPTREHNAKPKTREPHSQRQAPRPLSGSTPFTTAAHGHEQPLLSAVFLTGTSLWTRRTAKPRKKGERRPRRLVGNAFTPTRHGGRLPTALSRRASREAQTDCRGPPTPGACPRRRWLQCP